ncbi:hypothetical protein TNIN_445191 [Trichonephila inaurata madagascariensis]|uniref:Uncharacterized protein n=1 Tax=Trichonephila inaurata madagascariensis TaxID=2747483 RepID=A0A8X6Y8V5_9ARAC|nr:hypothetical protein TNIN_445191 [Trichonephila inaurata madagascariensis]
MESFFLWMLVKRTITRRCREGEGTFGMHGMIPYPTQRPWQRSGMKGMEQPPTFFSVGHLTGDNVAQLLQPIQILSLVLATNGKEEKAKHFYLTILKDSAILFVFIFPK